MRFQEGEIPAVPLGWRAGRGQKGSHMEVGAGFPGLPLHEPGLSSGAWAGTCGQVPLTRAVWAAWAGAVCVVLAASVNP